MEITTSYLKTTLSKTSTPNNQYNLPSEYTYLDILLQQKWGNADDWCKVFDGDMEDDVSHETLKAICEAVKYLLQKTIDEDRVYLINPLTGEIISWKELGINLPDVA